MEQRIEWITPQEAARRISKRAGYIVTPDDLKQLRVKGKITSILPLSSQIRLYDAKEIAEVKPPDKRVKRPFSEWEQFLKEEREKRKTRIKTP